MDVWSPFCTISILTLPLPTLCHLPTLSSPIWSMLTKGQLTKWEVDKVGIDKVGINKLGTDKLGTDKLGIEKVGRYHL